MRRSRFSKSGGERDILGIPLTRGHPPDPSSPSPGHPYCLRRANASTLIGTAPGFSEAREGLLSFSETYPYASDLAQILAYVRRHDARYTVRSRHQADRRRSPEGVYKEGHAALA